MDNPAKKSSTLIIIGLLAALLLTAGCSRTRHTYSSHELDSLISVLDDAIAHRSEFKAAKDAKIDSVRQIVDYASSPRERFDALGRLLEEYHSYNSDSALAICSAREALARSAGDPAMMLQARLSTANTLCVTGMSNEAVELMRDVCVDSLPEELHLFYYHIYRTAYGLLTDFAVRDEDRNRYAELTNIYRDSLLMFFDPESLYGTMIRCDRQNALGAPQKGIEMLESYIARSGDSPHDIAVTSYTLSESYRLLGNTSQQARYLIISAIGDIQSAVKEYVALRKLAILLYQEGDVSHAYEYLRICMDDALDCNARVRMIEINNILAAVNDVYVDTIRSQQHRLRLALTLACVLAVILACAVYLVYREMRKASRARGEVAAINNQLRDANAELKTVNERLNEANRAIAENSCLKEEYIARYMDQCIVYIEKLDRYRVSLNKIMKSGKVDDLKAFVHTLSKLDDEIKVFYDNFDKTFLNLFPTFVQDFNQLLLPDQQIMPRTAGTLTTELRIFALIRLGITDSVRIAQFLRYSVTTIYNYRTRVRNKARGNRDMLEAELMNIGKIG